MCDPATASTILAWTSGIGAATQVAGALNQPKMPKPPEAPKPPQAPKAPDEAAARVNNRDAILRAGIASTYKSPLGGVPVGSLNLGSSQLLGR